MTRHRVWCRPDVLVVLSADAPRHMHDKIADVVRSGDGGLDAVLNALTSDGLASTPTFLCAAPDALGLRVIVRGETRASVVATGGTRSPLDAGRASTWNDDVVSDVSHIELVDDGDVWLTWVASSETTAVETTAVETTAPVAPETAEPAEPVEPVDDGSHTLDEAAFQRLVDREDGPADPSAEEGDDTPDDAADDTPDDAADDAGTAPDAAPAVDDPAPLGSDRAASDYSGLLSSTSQLSTTPPPSRPSPPPSHPTSPSPGPVPAEPQTTPPPEPAMAEAPRMPEPEPVDPPVDVPTPTASAPTALPGATPLTSLITAVPMPTGSGPADTPADLVLPPDSGAPMTDTGMGEHDGLTITVADLARQTSLPEPRSDDGATVLAVHCPTGHPNPVALPVCRVCQQPIADRTTSSIHRPVIARMIFDSGLIVDVDRPQLIGRRPTVAADAGGEIPNLVALPSPEGDLSRQHVAVHVEGWDVLVEDLGSTNGTELELPGQPPVRLRSHEQTLATQGSTVVLAGIVRFHLAHPDH